MNKPFFIIYLSAANMMGPFFIPMKKLELREHWGSMDLYYGIK